MTSEALKPCPFCGGEAETFNPFNADGTWCVLCSECAAATGFEQTEAEAIAAWNTRSDYHGYEQAAIEAWESIKAWNTRAEPGSERISELEAENERLRKAGYEIGYHDAMKAAKRGGTLTAEQVREAVLENFEETHETRYDHWEPSKFDWQAIADELNAELGSGTCEFRPFKDEDWSEPNAVRGVCSKCSALMYGKDNYCPHCGRKAVSA